MRKIVELPYLQALAGDKESLRTTLCNLKFIKTKCKAKGVYEMIEDYYHAYNNSIIITKIEIKLIEKNDSKDITFEELNIFERFISANASISLPLLHRNYSNFVPIQIGSPKEPV